MDAAVHGDATAHVAYLVRQAEPAFKVGLARMLWMARLALQARTASLGGSARQACAVDVAGLGGTVCQVRMDTPARLAPMPWMASQVYLENLASVVTVAAPARTARTARMANLEFPVSMARTAATVRTEDQVSLVSLAVLAHRASRASRAGMQSTADEARPVTRVRMARRADQEDQDCRAQTGTQASGAKRAVEVPQAGGVLQAIRAILAGTGSQDLLRRMANLARLVEQEREVARAVLSGARPGPEENQGKKVQEAAQARLARTVLVVTMADAVHLAARAALARMVRMVSPARTV